MALCTDTYSDIKRTQCLYSPLFNPRLQSICTLKIATLDADASPAQLQLRTSLTALIVALHS